MRLPCLPGPIEEYGARFQRLSGAGVSHANDDCLADLRARLTPVDLHRSRTYGNRAFTASIERLSWGDPQSGPAGISGRLIVRSCP